MEFLMKVSDIFKVNEKTIFVGALEAPDHAISNVECAVKVNGEVIGLVHIEGEVHTSKPYRDLWTTSHIALTSKDVRQNDVLLVCSSGS